MKIIKITALLVLTTSSIMQASGVLQLQHSALLLRQMPVITRCVVAAYSTRTSPIKRKRIQTHASQTSNMLVPIKGDNNIIAKLPTEMTLAELQQKEELLKKQLNIQELERQIQSKNKTGYDMAHQHDKAKLWAKYISMGAEVSMQMLLWSVRLFGFKSPFGDRD